MNMKKIFGILKTIVTIFLVAVLIVIIFQKVTKNNLAIGGVRIFNIASESMAPKYQIGDILILKNVDPKEIKIGDDVTYLGTKEDFKGLVITHEVIDTRVENGKYYFETKGLANEYKDPEISEDDLYGKVVYKTVIFSFLGRLLSNTVMYYLLFTIAGVSISYQIIYAFFIKDEDEEDEAQTDE